MAAAPNALQPVAWECGNCAHTKEGTEPGPCAGCAAPEPVRYMIFKKKTRIPAPTAKTCSLRWNNRVALKCQFAAFDFTSGLRFFLADRDALKIK